MNGARVPTVAGTHCGVRLIKTSNERVMREYEVENTTRGEADEHGFYYVWKTTGGEELRITTTETGEVLIFAFPGGHWRREPRLGGCLVYDDDRWDVWVRLEVWVHEPA